MAQHQKPVTSRVLLLDTNLGFLFALAYELQKLGIAALPALSVKEANAVLAGFGPGMDLLIVKSSIRGALGFAAGLLTQNPALPVIAIVQTDQALPRRGVRFLAYLRDPDDVQPHLAPKWARLVWLLLRRAGAEARLRSHGSTQ
jgi:hypothetical protein